ncbi:hypothetical protein [Indioceanicola profundi]|uniref:hypothetical protein n=1 Tax=Indioceanicola profundi TaxID=2220096 RepID=UPI0013C492FD|nr:hypothetical protein [Indioceanicola profundi]
MREMRSLGFTEREVITAVVDLTRKLRQPLPSGQIIGIELKPNPVRAELTVEDDFGARKVVHRSSAELAASLINYCLERRIRLPSSGRKFVELIAGSLNLVIYMEDAAGQSKSRRTVRPASARA